MELLEYSWNVIPFLSLLAILRYSSEYNFIHYINHARKLIKAENQLKELINEEELEKSKIKETTQSKKKKKKKKKNELKKIQIEETPVETQSARKKEKKKINHFIQKSLGRINVPEGKSVIKYVSDTNSCRGAKNSPIEEQCQSLRSIYHQTQNSLDRYIYATTCVDEPCWDVGHCIVMENNLSDLKEEADERKIQKYCSTARENELKYGPITPYLNERSFSQKQFALEKWIKEMNFHVQELADYLHLHSEHIASLSVAADYAKLYQLYCDQVSTVLAKVDQNQYKNIIDMFNALRKDINYLFLTYNLSEWKTN
jgi:hypothetical protein